MKNKYKGIAFLGVSLLATGCGGPSTPTLEITQEEKVKPASSNFEYKELLQSSEDYNTSKWYKNELKHMQLPDPFVIEHEGSYYIYGTTDRTAANTFDCYETTDFNTFKLHKDIYVPSSDSFTKESLFAPEVYKFGDKFYLYYSGKTNGQTASRINVAVSDKPTGPFKEYKGKDFNGNEVDFTKEPMIKDIKSGKSLGILDQTLLVDAEKIYMYYSVYDSGIMQYIVGLEMFDPVTPNFDTYKLLVRPGELSPKTSSTNMLTWEALKGFKVAEGPCVIKSPVNNKFYLTYTVNHYPDRYYTVCYAVSDTPLGDYEKPFTKGEQWTNLLFGYAGGGLGTVYDQWEGFMSGTGHHSIFKVGDEYMITYHAHKNMENSNAGRMVCFDKVYFDEEGVPYANGPTRSLQSLPEEISGYKNIAGKAQIIAEGVENYDNLIDNFSVEHYNLNQEKDREANINRGKSYIKLQFDKEYTIGGLQIVNSAFYDKYVQDISYINLGNGNVILDGYFDSQSCVKDEKNFIFPNSNFTYDFEDIKTDKIIIGLENIDPVALNEIIVLGK